MVVTDETFGASGASLRNATKQKTGQAERLVRRGF